MVNMSNKPRFIQCVCTGECPGFKALMPDLWKLVNRVRNELDVSYAVVHPQLCVEDGDNFLNDLLQEGKRDIKYIISACDPKMQIKLFKDAFEKKGLDINSQMISLDFRSTGNRNISWEDAYKTVKETVERIENEGSK
ncbi:MAG: hypothetical protein QW201_01905 [Thermoproteota archaeon]